MRARPILQLLAGNFAAKGLTFLANTLLMAWWFGADSSTDAWLVAQVLPLFLVTALAWCAQAAVVPVLAQVREQRGDAAAAGVGGAAFLLAGAAGLLLAAAFAGLGTVVLPLLGRGLGEADQLLAVRLATILALGLPAAAAGAVAHAALVFRERFGAAALATATAPAAQLAILAALHGSHGVEAAAWAFVGGTAAQLLVQLVSLRGAAALSLRAPLLADAAVWRIGKLVIPGLVGAAAYGLFIAAYRAAGTSLDPGSLTAVDYALKLAQGLPLLAVAAVGTAILPRLSAHAAVGATVELGAELTRAIRVVAAFGAPFAVACALFGGEIAATVFAHGRFPPERVGAAAAALAALSPLVLALALGQLLEQGLFAQQKARVAVTSSLLALLPGLAVVGLLVESGGAPALAGAISVTYCTQTTLNLVLLRRSMGAALPVAAIVGSLLRPLALALAAGGAAALAASTSGLTGVAALALELGVALALYLALAPVAGVEAVGAVVRRLRGGPGTEDPATAPRG